MTNKYFLYAAITIILATTILTVKGQERISQLIPDKNTDSTLSEKNKEKIGETETASTKKRQSKSSDDWTGFYVGGFGNVTIGRARANTSTISGSQSFFTNASVETISTLGAQTIKPTGFNGGGTIGFNYQRGHFFVGGEADFGTNRINKSVTASGANPAQTANFTITQTVKSDYLFTARHRGGVAVKKALIYVTGGVAVTKIKYTENFTESKVIESESGAFEKTKSGWTAGAGTEIKVTGRWSVKGEYLFSKFGRTAITSNNFVFSTLSLPAPNQTFTHSTDLEIHSIRFGINYRF